MPKPHELIRRESVKKIPGKIPKMLAMASFTAKPELEDLYGDGITRNPKHFGWYQKWVLSRNPFPFAALSENDWYELRKDIFGLADDPTAWSGSANRALLLFLLDVLSPLTNPLMGKWFTYYGIKANAIKRRGDYHPVEQAAIAALVLCTPQNIKVEGYPDFINAFLDKFKFLFADEIGAKQKTLPKEDERFVKAFEKEWVKLYPFSDDLYGFEVIPAVSYEDMLRYLKLPFRKKIFSSLTKEKIHQQVINYIVALTTFKPVPDTDIREHFRREIPKLFRPLMESIAEQARWRNKPREGNISYLPSKKELVSIMEQRLRSLLRDFNFFYATQTTMEKEIETAERKKKDLAPTPIRIFPLNGRLVKLGHIAAGDEYPFTDYIASALEKIMQEYMPKNIAPAYLSLDNTMGTNDDGEAVTFGQIVAGSDLRMTDEADRERNEREARTRSHPAYDAKDAKGETIGWRVDTFARMIGRDPSTLRRWDEAGDLKPLRYNIRSRAHRTTVPYRAYIEEHLARVPEVEQITEERMKRGKKK